MLIYLTVLIIRVLTRVQYTHVTRCETIGIRETRAKCRQRAFTGETHQGRHTVTVSGTIFVIGILAYTHKAYLAYAIKACLAAAIDVCLAYGFGRNALVHEAYPGRWAFKSGFALSVGGFAAEGGAVPNIAFSIPFGRWKN